MIIMPINSWSDFKTLVMTTKKLKYQHSETATRYDVYANELVFVWSISLVKGSTDANDFEDNYLSGSNLPLFGEVVTQLEKDDKDLKICCLRDDTDTQTGEASVQIAIPGVMADGDGRYVVGGEAFFATANLEDKVTAVEVVDIDNVLGGGANVVVKTFHDDEVDSANAGWYVGIDQYDTTGNTSYIEIKPMGGYAFIPAELYLRIKAKKDPANKTNTFYCNITWGKLS